MILAKRTVISAIIFTSLLLLITMVLVIKTSSNYVIYRNLEFSFRVLRDPSIQANGQTYLGTPFIDFALPDISGTPHRLYDIKSAIKVIVLFNTKDCAGCLEEYRFWKKLDAIYADETVTVIAITSDKEINEVKSFIMERGLQFAVFSDPDNFIRKSMGFRYSPLRIIVNNKNVIIDIAVAGMNLSQQNAFLSYINSVLEKQKE